MTTRIVQGNALALPITDDSVDLIVTSPPYFGLRSYKDGGEHYDGQIGSEATPTEFVDALIAATREMIRVLKPSGSIWINLGDKYAINNRGSGYAREKNVNGTKSVLDRSQMKRDFGGLKEKSLIGVPWRYALSCIDELGLILRAEVIWAKPNGLPESVKDRVSRKHEQWFHFTISPRYFTGVDEIREAVGRPPSASERVAASGSGVMPGSKHRWDGTKGASTGPNPLGKLPGSVWTIATEPLQIPDWLGVEHYAAFPTEWPRRIIRGWAPTAVCDVCGEGLRPVTDKTAVGRVDTYNDARTTERAYHEAQGQTLNKKETFQEGVVRTITGYTCACPEPSDHTHPAVVLDPFGGTGTTALVAQTLGRDVISVDMSADYCRVARWRTTDPGQIEKCTAKNEGRKPRKLNSGRRAS